MAATDPETAFLKAAYGGNLMILKRLATKAGNGKLLTKAYETIADANGRNALHLAAAIGNTRICKFLVEELNYELHFGEDQGNTPLLVAILSHHHSTAVYLIEKGAASIDSTNHWGFTALHYAAEHGQKEIVRLLLSKGANIVPDLGVAVCTPLQRACSHGKKECAKLLLDNGADPNLTTEFYFPPLMLSIVAESYECVEMLLKAGADPNLGTSAKVPLILAACGGDIRIIKRLLEAGANPNFVEPLGLMTPIELSALHGNVAAVKTLFPCTSRISSFPDWSVNGIMKHIFSEEATTKRDNRKKECFELAKSLGREAFERENYEVARMCYTQAIDTDPTDATVFSNRSLCWVMLNEAEHALVDAEACVALKPDWPKAHYREGAAWMLLHEYSKASKAFSKALKLDPNNKEIKKAHREAVEAESDLRHF